MRQVTDNTTNINADINALVDRIWIDDGAFNLPASFVEDIRKSDQYQVKDLLIQIEHTLKNDNAKDSLTVYADQLDHLAHRVGMDHIDVPLTEEEQAEADYEGMMLIQSKRDRREWAMTPEGILDNETIDEIFKELGGIGIVSLGSDQCQKLINEKIQELKNDQRKF